MGEPAARPVIQEWIDRLFETVPPKQAPEELSVLKCPGSHPVEVNGLGRAIEETNCKGFLSALGS